MSHWVDAVGLAQEAFDTTSKEFDAQYGEDYTYLGYKTGFGSLVINMGNDFHNAFQKDLQGSNTTELPVTKKHKWISGLRLCDLSGSGQHARWYLDTLWTENATNLNLALAVPLLWHPINTPTLQSGQMNGMMGGLAGAAEYETLD